MNLELEGHTIVVTGAAKGIGLAISRRFAELGAKVSGWDLDPRPDAADPAFAHFARVDVTDLLGAMSAEYIAEKKARIPMGRFCSVQEIADMAAWVASPRCSFTTGQVFDVTGGRATY